MRVQFEERTNSNPAGLKKNNKIIYCLKTLKIKK